MSNKPNPLLNSNKIKTPNQT